jgi:hypothetical protein
MQNPLEQKNVVPEPSSALNKNSSPFFKGIFQNYALIKPKSRQPFGIIN